MKLNILILIFLLFNLALLQGQISKTDSLINKSRELVLQRKYKEAVESVDKILKIENLTNRQKLGLTFTKARVYSHEGRIFKSLELSNESYNYTSTDEDKIGVLSFIGYQYYNDKVEKYLEKAEKIVSESPTKDSINPVVIGNLFLIRGITYRENIECDFAVSYFDKAIKEFSKTKDNREANFNICTALTEKGFCYFEKNELDSAFILFEKTAEISEPHQLSETLVTAQAAMANIYINRNELEKAGKLLHHIKGEDVKSFSHQNKLRFYNSLSNFYLKQNDTDNYTKYSDHIIQTEHESDRLAFENFSIAINDTSIKFNSKKRQLTTNFLITIVIISTLFIALFIILRSRFRNKAKKNLPYQYLKTTL